MINWSLAIIAALMWVAAFVWYFWPEVQRAWGRRRQRRAKSP
jgi:hypothetical protein